MIGAGLSGLAAATRLKRLCPDLSVKVLEAMSRVGGRTQTIAVGKDTFDLGAHWVSSSQEDIMTLLERLNIDYYPQNISGTKVMQVGKGHKVTTYKSDIPSLGSWKALAEMQLLINRAERLAKEVDIRDPYAHPNARNLDSITVQTFVRQSSNYQEVLDVFEAALHASFGCGTADISPLYLAAYANAAGGIMKLLLAEKGAAQEFRVLGGTQQISIELAKELGEDNVILDMTVTKIEDGSPVKVTCADGSTFCCHRVICSAPAPQMARINFSPPMSNARKSIVRSFHMGNLAKVFVLYKESFWATRGFSGEVVATGGDSNDSDGRRQTAGPVTVFLDATTNKNTPALVGFIAGQNADQWFSQSKEKRREAVLKQIALYFGQEQKAMEPTVYLEKDWTEEPSVGGAPVALARPGVMHNYDLLRRPHGRIHIAGSETATKWCGYLSGAVHAGERAAAEVAKALRGDEVLEQRDRLRLSESEPPKIKHVKTRFLNNLGHPSDMLLQFLALVAVGSAWMGHYWIFLALLILGGFFVDQKKKKAEEKAKCEFNKRFHRASAEQ